MQQFDHKGLDKRVREPRTHYDPKTGEGAIWVPVTIDDAWVHIKLDEMLRDIRTLRKNTEDEEDSTTELLANTTEEELEEAVQQHIDEIGMKVGAALGHSGGGEVWGNEDFAVRPLLPYLKQPEPVNKPPDDEAHVNHNVARLSDMQRRILSSIASGHTHRHSIAGDVYGSKEVMTSDPAKRAAFSRALSRLERRGLVQVVRLGSGTGIRFSLTDVGEDCFG